MALLYLMFSTGRESVHREGLFGSVFFETTQVRPGVTGATMGVANPTGLIVIFLMYVAFLTLTQVTYRGLKTYRARLIKERSNS
jgi:hypothetical protein